MTSSIYLEQLLHRSKIFVSLDFEIARFYCKVLILQTPNDTEGRLSMRSHFGSLGDSHFIRSVFNLFRQYLFYLSARTVQTVTRCRGDLSLYDIPFKVESSKFRKS